jgi:glyoxylase-like metal-dependent hydrolase (beta-lactamase superfamily II)
MIEGAEKALGVADNDTKIIPGHGPLGSKSDLEKYRDMLKASRDKVAALKAAGASEQEVIAKKPLGATDPAWGMGFVNGDVFTGIIYRTL